MSVNFYINNKKGLFRFKTPLTVDECINLSSQKIEQFSFDETLEDFDVNGFYKSHITDYDALVLGVYKKSSRGFEVSYEKDLNQYCVRVCTPSSKEDWEIALQYIKDLAEKMRSDIVNDLEEHFTTDTIQKFDYKKDILFGLKASKAKDKLITFGLIREVVLNEKIVEGFLASDKPIEAFSKFYRDIQYMNAYSAKQRFYRNTDTEEIFGMYTLTQETRTILPYEPSVEFRNLDTAKDDDVKKWKISLCVINGNPDDPNSYSRAGELEYSNFIERLSKEKYKFIDAAYIVVEELTQKEILDLLRE